MKILAAALILATAAPLLATAAVAAPPAAATKYSLDTPLETLVADPKAKAVLTADLGQDVTAHPMYAAFKAMSLNKLAPMSRGQITDAQLKKIGTDLSAIR